jgi:hypothetical protein
MRIIPVVLTCALSAGSVVAQQKPQATTQERPATPSANTTLNPFHEQTKPLVPVKVQIVLTRLKGEKKISSLPYQLGVTANDGQKTSLRMGVDVPVVSTVFRGGGGDNASIPQTSWNYRNVGTNIDCRADSVTNDVIKLSITVTDSTIHLESLRAPGEKSAVASDVPAFRSFNSTFTVLMRDGQTTQHTSAVDPVNGEVMKIDVTLNVVK